VTHVDGRSNHGCEFRIWDSNPCTKLRSILTSWTGKRTRWLSEEYPVPKSVDGETDAECGDGVENAAAPEWDLR